MNDHLNEEESETDLIPSIRKNSALSRKKAGY
jgi:hypothetical protein